MLISLALYDISRKIEHNARAMRDVRISVENFL